MIKPNNLQFSVLIAVYFKDNADHLYLSLESLFQQTLKPDEIVLVQDGPLTAALYDVLEFFKNKNEINIHVLALGENKGLGLALQTGLQLCQYSIVVRMDSDDICCVDRFEKQITYLSHNPDISVIGSAVEEFNTEPGDLSRFRRLPSSHIDILKFSKYRNPINHPSVAFRKDHILKVGSYLDMPLFEDYYLWIRVLMSGYKMANLDDVLLKFRIGNDMIGRRHGISYLKKEIYFLNTIRALGHLSFLEYFFSLVTKIPLRLLPKSALERIYKKFLR